MKTKQIQFSSDIEPVRHQLQEWRRTRKYKTAPIPEALWIALARLARIYGVNRVSRELRIEYSSLKNRAEAGPLAQAMATGRHDHFVEVSMGPPPPSAGCIVELEDRRGSKMTLRLAATNGTDVLTMVEAFWRRGV